MQTDAKQSGQVRGISDRSDPIRRVAKSLMSQRPMQEYGACSRCFRVKHHRRYRSDTVHVYHKGEIRRCLHCIMGNECSGCSSCLAFKPICFNKMVPGFQLFSYIKKKKCRCCNVSIICSAYNPDALRTTRISEVKGHVRQWSEGHGAETYMGVLSLQRWGGESDC